MRTVHPEKTNRRERARINHYAEELSAALVAVMTTRDMELIVEALETQSALKTSQAFRDQVSWAEVGDLDLITLFMSKVNEQRAAITAVGRFDADKER